MRNSLDGRNDKGGEFWHETIQFAPDYRERSASAWARIHKNVGKARAKAPRSDGVDIHVPQRPCWILDFYQRPGRAGQHTSVVQS
ncbi:hypothetical protein [Puniceicoccus vermicola]|uniref:Uncharacterized protein n=1 Tax=Puniceicoccus vermicola TaxID=388746 RepID=A0A7X1E4P3_9BACT|nr:hypothetical protein [Puniceicoccus vermicola]MBC2602269.1 hypothetical protein [Puniceicoccus vermicola]